jgi:multimeric flavodoxin WrbA
VWSARTASSVQELSISTAIMISDAEMFSILMPRLENASNMVLATPTWLRMPTPITETFGTSSFTSMQSQPKLRAAPRQCG